jgi:hypothetical protein
MFLGKFGVLFLMRFQYTERIADPLIVSTLLSVVLSCRNKLASFGHAMVGVAY